MCLGIPGEVLELWTDPPDLLMGRVRFGGITREVCLAYVPDIHTGEFVVVHAGFAISKLDAEEAGRVFELLDELGEVDDALRR